MTRLKLRAEDEEDLRTMSAILQDALVSVADMAWLADENRFVLVANRFRWEAEGQPLAADPAAGQGEDAVEAVFERVLTGLCFEGVAAVKLRNLDRRRSSQILALLSIEHHQGCITLHFAGGGAVRLDVSQVRCRLDDLCEPWPTPFRPRHALDPEEPDVSGRQ